jgi:hypothetical protein
MRRFHPRPLILGIFRVVDARASENYLSHRLPGNNPFGTADEQRFLSALIYVCKPKIGGV